MTASHTEQGHSPDTVVNGCVQLDDCWGGTARAVGADRSSGSSYKLDRVVLYTYWDGHRYYQYTVEVSVDGKNWTQVVDMTKNTKVATADGISSEFPPCDARYVKVNMLKNSDNEGVHVVRSASKFEAK